MNRQTTATATSDVTTGAKYATRKKPLKRTSFDWRRIAAVRDARMERGPPRTRN